MNRRDFIRSLFATGVAVVAAPLMPAKSSPLLFIGQDFGSSESTTVFTKWMFQSVGRARYFYIYSSSSPQRGYASTGPWRRV